MSTKPTVIIDTREQLPYAFSDERFDAVRRALPAGDYSLAGFETRVAVERKTLADLVGTLIRSRARFKRELQKLETYDLACVVVEGHLRDVLDGNYRSQAHPNSVLGSVIAVCVDHQIPIFFCSDREAARQFTEKLLLRFYKKVSTP